MTTAAEKRLARMEEALGLDKEKPDPDIIKAQVEALFQGTGEFAKSDQEDWTLDMNHFGKWREADYADNGENEGIEPASGLDFWNRRKLSPLQMSLFEAFGYPAWRHGQWHRPEWRAGQWCYPSR